MDHVFDALSYVRRHTSNPQVLLICDTLSRLLQRGNTVADMSQVAVVRPIPECPVCAARKASAPPKRKKAKRNGRKANTKGQARQDRVAVASGGQSLPAVRKDGNYHRPEKPAGAEIAGGPSQDSTPTADQR